VRQFTTTATVALRKRVLLDMYIVNRTLTAQSGGPAQLNVRSFYSALGPLRAIGRLFCGNDENHPGKLPESSAPLLASYLVTRLESSPLT